MGKNVFEGEDFLGLLSGEQPADPLPLLPPPSLRPLLTGMFHLGSTQNGFQGILNTVQNNKDFGVLGKIDVKSVPGGAWDAAGGVSPSNLPLNLSRNILATAAARNA